MSNSERRRSPRTKELTCTRSATAPAFSKAATVSPSQLVPAQRRTSARTLIVFHSAFRNPQSALRFKPLGPGLFQVRHGPRQGFPLHARQAHLPDLAHFADLGERQP